MQRSRHEDYIKSRIRIQGFTLIELSIVLVIIGLLVGGVLVGRDLISAAEVRAQITQIEKYNSAVNTFKGKFNAIAGDMRPEIASQFGFVVLPYCAGVIPGMRDGNGLIDGPNGAGNMDQIYGETGFFWQDLSSNASGNLIEGQFPGPGAQTFTCGGSIAPISGTGINLYFPPAKIGHANYLYVYENSGFNWFGLSGVTSVGTYGTLYSAPSLSVLQAYKIDSKIDDAIPTTGAVQVNYLYGAGSILRTSGSTTTAGGNSTSCFDTTTGNYSITYNNGSGGNCALSFKMQGAGP